MGTVLGPIWHGLWWGIRYGLRLCLVIAGVAGITFGMAYWQHIDFTFEGLWFEDGLVFHPLHSVAIGIAIVPSAIWDVVIMEAAETERMVAARSAGE